MSGVHDIAPVHVATVERLLRGAWRNSRNEEMQFAGDGTYRTGAASGLYSIDGDSGALTLGTASAQAIRWDDRDRFVMAGVRWERSN